MQLTSTPKSGFDSWTDVARPHDTNGGGKWVQVQVSARHGFLWIPFPAQARGKVIESATLTAHVAGATSAQSVYFLPADRKWQASRVHWSTEPGVLASPTATAVLGALADGAEVDVDFTALAQFIADGNDNHGWRLTATGSVKFYSFNSGQPSWTLTIEYAEGPEAPTGLVPNGSVVSVAQPTGTFDFHDYGGTGNDLASVRVEVSVGNDGSVDYDSGWVPTTDPQAPLAITATAGALMGWRVAVQDTGGAQSDFSDWASYTYQPLPTLTLDSPAAGVLYDPTSDVIAHLGSGTLDAFRIQVTDGDDRTSVRYDSGKQQATDPTQIAFTLPLKSDDGSRIFTDDADYQIHVRAWDTYDRQATPAGGVTYSEVWTTVHFDDDLALSPVTSFQADQIDRSPFVRLTWTDAAAADAYSITRDSVHIARLDPADVVSGVSGYSWTDVGAKPGELHVYRLYRLTDGVGRSPARMASVQLDVEGVWLLRDNGDSVVLDDLGIDQLATLTRRSVYKPLHVPYDVDIITAYEGISGPLALSVDDAVDRDLNAALGVLSAIKGAPSEPVRLIYATVSKPVYVRDLSVLPASDVQAANYRHNVTFTVSQCGEFDHRVR